MAHYQPAGTAVNPKKKTFYRPELDVLRFFAFLMVFIHHAAQGASQGRLVQYVLEAGRFGVALFFMLSAYLITELLLREREKTGSIHVKAFFVRRVLRIWPLYFLALALGFLLGHFVSNYRIPGRALPFMLLLAGNFFVTTFGWHLGAIFPLWSLSVEEQFYLAIPAVTKLGGKRALRAVSFLCLGAAYAALAWLGARHVDPSTHVWANSLVLFQFFAAGTLLAIFLHGREWRVPLPVRAGMLLVGLAGLVANVRLLHFQYENPIAGAQLCAGYGIGLLCSLAIFLAFLSVPLRAPRPLVYLGRISYGLYVFQGFALIFTIDLPDWAGLPHFNRAEHLLAQCAAFLLTVLLASASFHLFEKKILRFKERFAFVRSGAEARS